MKENLINGTNETMDRSMPRRDQHGLTHVGLQRKETLAGFYGEDVEYGLQSKLRKQKICMNLGYAIFELTMVGLATLLIINYTDNGIKIFKLKNDEFRRNIVIWTEVYAGLYFIIFLRRIVLTFLWCFHKDPRPLQARSNFFTFIFLNTFEVAWFIYGNTLFWGPDGLYAVNDNDEEDIILLRRIMLTVLIWGYITMFVYLITILGIILILVALSMGGFLSK